MAIILFVLILSFLVLIHEAGHFLAAKWLGVGVEEFGLGYPPRAKKLFRWWGTLFSLNWIPFGGFVRLVGEEAGDKVDASQRFQSFGERPAWARLVIILAGATVNFIFGMVAFSIVFSWWGIPQLLPDARIVAVTEGSPAAEAGVPTDVSIIKIVRDQAEVTSPSLEEAIAFIQDSRGQTIELSLTGACQGSTCLEMIQTYQVYVRTVEETPPQEGSVGIAFDQLYFQHYSWYEMPFRGTYYGTQQAIELGWLTLRAVGDMVSQVFTRGQIPADLSGPVGIVHQAQKYSIFEQGPLAIISFMGMISINLGVMNVLPIPALDGGRALFIILEMILGKKRTQWIESYAHYGGFVVLLTLIILITARDIFRIFQG